MRFRKPNRGDIRNRKSFLLFPKKIQEETRWFEMAEWEEQYKPRLETGIRMRQDICMGWVPTRWLY